MTLSRTWSVVVAVCALSQPAAAAPQELAGIVVGQTSCVDALARIYARARDEARKERSARSDTSHAGLLRAQLGKPRGDKTSELALELELLDRSEKTERSGLAAATAEKTRACEPVEGPVRRSSGLNGAGWPAIVGLWSEPFKGLLPAPHAGVPSARTEACPYASLVSLWAKVPEKRLPLLCVDGVVEGYEQKVLVGFLEVKEHLGKEHGRPEEVADWPMHPPYGPDVRRVLFRAADGFRVLSGDIDGPDHVMMRRRAAQRGLGAPFELPPDEQLVFFPQSTVVTVSAKGMAAIEKNRKAFEARAAREAARDAQEQEARKRKALEEL
jgi:hypothetical protein